MVSANSIEDSAITVNISLSLSREKNAQMSSMHPRVLRQATAKTRRDLRKNALRISPVNKPLWHRLF